MICFFEDDMNAIDGSIKKWKDIVFNGDNDYGERNCELCGSNYDCMTCPVYFYTRESGCKNSPYDHWTDLNNARNFPYRVKNAETRMCANHMLSFLYEVRLFWINRNRSIKAI